MIEAVAGVDGLQPSHGRLWLVIGVFDGLHRGHAWLLDRLVEGARRRDARPAVITFDAHPDQVLVGHAPPLLLDPDERLERLAAAGVEVVVVQPFDDEVRRTTFEAFIESIASRVDLAGFLMTPDSAFGYQRRGTPEAVTELGTRLGYEVDVVSTFEIDGRPVSSSEIRRRIGAGDLAGAAALLGRPYEIVGRVGDDGVLRTPMPVALPPAGTWPARDGWAGGSATIEVVADQPPRVSGVTGEVRLQLA